MCFKSMCQRWWSLGSPFWLNWKRLMLKIKSAIATTTTTTKTATTTNREHKSSAARSAAAARPCLSTYFLHFAFFFLSFLLSLTFFVCLLPARILAKCRLRQSSRYRRRRWRRCGHRNRFLFFFCLLLLLLFFLLFLRKNWTHSTRNRFCPMPD